MTATKSFTAFAALGLLAAGVTTRAIPLDLPNLSLPRVTADEASYTEKLPHHSRPCQQLHRKYHDTCDASGARCTMGRTATCKGAVAGAKTALACAAMRADYLDQCKYPKGGQRWIDNHLQQVRERLHQAASCVRVVGRRCGADAASKWQRRFRRVEQSSNNLHSQLR